MRQKTIVERMKPLYPGLTQPVVSAVARKTAGVQWSTAFRRAAEKEGIVFRRDREGRSTPVKLNFRVTEAEAAAFYRYLEATGKTGQEVMRTMLREHIPQN
jgi:hypothetical protein